MLLPKANGPARLIPIDKIEFGDGFRVILDAANMDKLRRLRETGTIFDPVKVMELPRGRYRLISGNHRRQLAADRGETQIQALIYDLMSELEFTRFGIAENTGVNGKNPLAPTEDDLRLNIRLLIKLNQTPKQIISAIPMPEPYVRDLLLNVQSSILKQKKADAIARMTVEDITYTQAAKREGLDPEALKRTIERRNKKRGDNHDSNNPARNDNAKLGGRIGGFSKSLSFTLKTALFDLSEGRRTQKSVIDVINHVEELLKSVVGQLSNARVRATNLA